MASDKAVPRVPHATGLCRRPLLQRIATAPPMTEAEQKKPAASKNDPGKADRLAEQLRANLRRRKVQNRGCKAEASKPDE